MAIEAQKRQQDNAARELDACTGGDLSALWFWGHALLWKRGKIL